MPIFFKMREEAVGQSSHQLANGALKRTYKTHQFEI
jgi:hypothetical protein